MTGHSIWMPRLLTLPFRQNPSSGHRAGGGRWLRSVSTATPRDTRLLMMEDTRPPGLRRLDTQAPPDHTLPVGMKVGTPGTMMTALRHKAPAGLMGVDLRGLTVPGSATAPMCLTLQSGVGMEWGGLMVRLILRAPGGLMVPLFSSPQAGLRARGQDLVTLMALCSALLLDLDRWDSSSSGPCTLKALRTRWAPCGLTVLVQCALKDPCSPGLTCPTREGPRCTSLLQASRAP